MKEVNIDVLEDCAYLYKDMKEKLGVQIKATDFARLCGGSNFFIYGYDRVFDSTFDKYGYGNGYSASLPIECYNPTIIKKTGLSGKIGFQNNNWFEFETDQFYPQTIAQNQEELEYAASYEDSAFVRTGRKYTVYAVDNEGDPLESTTLYEYEYKSQRYVKMYSTTNTKLDNGKSVKEGDAFWVKVEPVKYLGVYNKKCLFGLSECALATGLNQDEVGDFVKDTLAKEFVQPANYETFVKINKYKKPERRNTDQM